MGGLKITETDGGLCIKADTGKGLILLPFLAFLLWKILPDLIDMFPPRDKNDYAGIICLSIWLLILVGVIFFVTVKSLVSRVELNHRGVFYADGLRRREIAWSEIKDYGLSYEGRTQGGGKLYTLYFSQEISCPEKNRNKKKLKGVVVKLDANENDYASILTKVLPYCQRHLTVIKPFVAE